MVSSENLKTTDRSPAQKTGLAPTYSQDEVQQILHLALSRKEEGGEISRAQMLEIAQDLNIPLAHLEAAEKEWLSRSGDFEERQVFETYRRKKLKKNAVNYGIFNSFFVLLNLAGSGELSWSLYILLFWGLGLALQGWNSYQSEGEEYEQAFQRWRVKKQLGQSVNSLVNKFQKWIS
ncbi:2TM domain-containing protein [Ancylothrix sp. C2]|uniref:2TM domain-containing protein n=1 Tax=Ancylothrix sp. D3o TaxID=2953691 RepID=UPI0021BAA9EC|nr:2TM domain-containing protein [Ancylothrix sp. D3o]MCT7948603.1 2TM domain-containing protein [Ancylothrix sp. D3o]